MSEAQYSLSRLAGSLTEAHQTLVMPRRIAKAFIITAGSILAAAGAVKLASAWSTARILDLPDPILALPFGRLMVLVGGLELLVAWRCFSGARLHPKLALVGWLSSIFLVYRFGLWFIDWNRPCGCLGSLPDALHISPHTVDQIMKYLLAYLLGGSLLVLAWLRGRDQSAEAPERRPPTHEDCDVC